jgi:hypothetical protein
VQVTVTANGGAPAEFPTPQFIPVAIGAAPAAAVTGVNIALGCTNDGNNNTIQFPSVAGSNDTVLSATFAFGSQSNQVVLGANGSPVSATNFPVTPAQLSISPSGLSTFVSYPGTVVNPTGGVLGTVLCAAVVTPNVTSAPFNTGEILVPAGNINYTVNNPLVEVTNLNGQTASTLCAGGPAVTAFGGNSCVGAVQNGTNLSPNPANDVILNFRPGSTYPVLAANQLTLANSLAPVAPNVTLSATYVSTSVQVTLSASASLNVPISLPQYALTLTASPSAITAAGGPGAGSTITATVLHVAAQGSLCLPLGGVAGTYACGNGSTPFVAGTAALLTGGEPGTILFTTSNGYFGAPSTPQTGGQQTTAVACGPVPNQAPTLLIPQFGVPFSFSFTSCTNASVTLYGGGSVGQAVVVGTYTGSYTGATAQASVTVSLTTTPANTTLSRGCNEVVVNANGGLTAQQVLALASTPGNVVSIWQYNNSLHAFQALYFSTSGAPTDISSVGAGSQSVFYCVSGPVTITTGF